VSQAIIDLFQAIDVRKKEQRALVVAACKLELLASQCKKAATVVEARQVVGERKVSQFLLGHALLDRIAGCPN
jgi:hypothetical protein